MTAREPNAPRPRLLAPVAAAVAVLSGVLLLRRAPADRTARRGRGAYSHAPGGQALAAGFETKDLSARGLAIVIGVLGLSAATLIAAVFALALLFRSWDRQAAAHLTPQQTQAIAPPPPNLQADPVGDLARLRQRERHVLAAYAWADAGHARARIPIARAQALLIGRTLDPLAPDARP